MFQTYVEALKKNGNFDTDSQKIAFERAKAIVINQFTPEITDFVKTNYGDVTSWITTQIEASINTLKNK